MMLVLQTSALPLGYGTFFILSPRLEPKGGKIKSPPVFTGGLCSTHQQSNHVECKTPGPLRMQQHIHMLAHIYEDWKLFVVIFML